MIPEREFPAGGHTYRASRVSAFEQMNLASEFRDGLSGLAFLKRDRPKKVTDEQFHKTVEFIMTGGAAHISPEVRQRVMNRCLSVVVRKEAAGWAPVMNGDGTLMFMDIGLSELIVIMYEVFDHNGLLDFFSEGPSGSKEQMTESNGPRSRTQKTG